MKPLIIALLISQLLPAAPASAAAPSKAEVNCAAEDMQLFYYYLAPEVDAKVKSRATSCHAEKTIAMPAWLEKERPGMLERKVWKDPEEGELSEAAVWQTPVSILYEFSSMAQRGGNPFAEEAAYVDMRLRFIMSLDRISRAKLERSLGGRGAGMLAALDEAMRDFDRVMGAVENADRKAFDSAAAGLLRHSRAAFSLLFEAPREAKGADARYKPAPYILPGYRGVTLPVSGPQALFLSPGDRADMLVTFEAVLKDGVKEKVTATILQNVVVTKVHRPEAPDGTGAVQMLVNPMEAQYASLSLSQGSNIVITRRAEGDVEMHPMEIASFRKLFK